MENKFYTPKINEFFIGFEYESKENFQDGTVKSQEQFDTARWIKEIFSNGDSPYVNRALSGKNADNNRCGIRVKYLDSSDIESLGFRLRAENKFRIVFVNNLYSIVLFKAKDNHFEISLTQPYIKESNGLKFSGLIKNKSELKRILIQLEIINE